MRRLILLASMWGGSFIFIRIAAPVFGPVLTVESRVVLAGLLLLVYAAVTRASLEVRTRWKQYLILGALNSAIPFLLITTAELRLTASMAAILNATSPLFAYLAAAIWLKEPLTARGFVGIGTALLGVIVLVGWSPLERSLAVGLSILASLAAAACYGFAGVYTRSTVRGTSPLAMAAGAQLGAGALLVVAVPFAPLQGAVTSTALLSILSLSILCTSAAYILYFRLIVDVGPTRALTVTFLTPIFGQLWGALFLGEPITIPKVAASMIILVGAGLVTRIWPTGVKSPLSAQE